MSRKIVATSVFLIASFMLFEFSSLDLLIQDNFYNFETNQWLIDRNDKVLKFLFYDGIKRLYLFLILFVLAALVFFRNLPVVVAYKQGLRVVLMSLILVPLLIGSLKAVTNMPCPRDLKNYNGLYPYVTVLESYPANFKQSKKMKCYPAGHASGGFALLAFFFLFKTRRKKQISIVVGITLGWVSGSYKILIGDHFVSHNIVTMLIAWILILVLHQLVSRYENIGGRAASLGARTAS